MLWRYRRSLDTHDGETVTHGDDIQAIVAGHTLEGGDDGGRAVHLDLPLRNEPHSRMFTPEMTSLRKTPGEGMPRFAVTPATGITLEVDAQFRALPQRKPDSAMDT